jgi:hypothetical protein
MSAASVESFPARRRIEGPLVPASPLSRLCT